MNCQVDYQTGTNMGDMNVIAQLAAESEGKGKNKGRWGGATGWQGEILGST